MSEVLGCCSWLPLAILCWFSLAYIVTMTGDDHVSICYISQQKHRSCQWALNGWTPGIITCCVCHMEFNFACTHHMKLWSLSEDTPPLMFVLQCLILLSIEITNQPLENEGLYLMKWVPDCLCLSMLCSGGKALSWNSIWEEESCVQGKISMEKQDSRGAGKHVTSRLRENWSGERGRMWRSKGILFFVTRAGE